MSLTHLSLFSGIGGMDLAAEWAGFETVGQVEWADYPTKVLEKHWPNVPRWRDIRDVKGEMLPNGVTVISGGFPCQPFSVAGKQKGKEDNRYLWPEMLRVIREVHPTWVIGENVKGIISIALDTVLENLEAEGYTTQAFCVPALSVGAPHRRERVFIVAYAGRTLRQGSEFERTYGNEVAAGLANIIERPSSPRTDDLADANSEGLQRSSQTGDTCSERPYSNEQSAGCCDGYEQWAVEPNVGRVAHGIPSRMDRLKCLGNAVVPQQVYPIFKAIADIEGGLT